MPRPRHVDLGPHRYTITWPTHRWPADTNDPGAADDEFRIGETNLLDNTIAIATDTSPTQQASTLVHEIIHAAFHQSPMRCTAGWNAEVEEAIVIALEARLLELFTRNPKVVAWLASGGSA